MVPLKLKSNLTFRSDITKHSPLTPISWSNLGSNSFTKDDLEDNLLYFQTSELGLGEVNRFTITIDKTQLNENNIEHDEISDFIWLHIKNRELDLLRPIYITGPFTLYVDVVPYNYLHLRKFDEEIQYDSDVKPGQTFHAKLRFTKGSLVKDEIYSWSVDVISQLALATAFHISYVISIGYDHSLLKKVADKNETHSKIDVQMYNTNDIWEKPPPNPEKPAHLVIITHGIFSNIGGDMLYIKDRIEDASSRTEGSNVIVRGWNGNSGKSEKGIKYLGKRVAKFAIKTVEESSYNIDRISFVGHSLGGPVQAYALAYIIWTKPDFFKGIVPVNFIILASPMLGITEFPKAVSLALDIGLLGITGRDLTLRRKFPSLTKKSNKDENTSQIPNHLTTKPILLQLLLPPAHSIFEKFVSRTLYSNAINDGIVSLRTSALLYLDWKGLGDIELLKKEYNENANAVAEEEPDETKEDSEVSLTRDLDNIKLEETEEKTTNGLKLLKNPSTTLFAETKKRQKRKKLRKYIRTQTVNSESSGFESELNSSSMETESGNQTEPTDEQEDSNLHVPPVASTVLTAANVIFAPKPKQTYLCEPSARPPSIFHDKTYTFTDLPPSHYSIRKKLSLSRDKKALQEQIARSWHKRMEWRKVLVTLAPDAHNNIAVRRRFVNAWGWEVIDHMVENHFGPEALKKELEAVTNMNNQ